MIYLFSAVWLVGGGGWGGRFILRQHWYELWLELFLYRWIRIPLKEGFRSDLWCHNHCLLCFLFPFGCCCADFVSYIILYAFFLLQQKDVSHLVTPPFICCSLHLLFKCICRYRCLFCGIFVETWMLMFAVVSLRIKAEHVQGMMGNRTIKTCDHEVWSECSCLNVLTSVLSTPHCMFKVVFRFNLQNHSSAGLLLHSQPERPAPVFI